MATIEAVERTLHDLARRLGEASMEDRGLPESRKLLVRIRDLGAVFTATFGEGRISDIAPGDGDESVDVRISVGSDDLIALAEGRLGVGSAMLTGKLRVDAGFRDLLLIRQLF